MSESAPRSKRSIVVDSGVLVAALAADEPDHAWARHMLTGLRGSFFTCEACLTEAVHLVGNSAGAVSRLALIVERMEIVSFATGGWRQCLERVVALSPKMDYADACIVSLVQARRGAFALTLDRRDFSAYRIPFACPSGDFYL